MIKKFEKQREEEFYKRLEQINELLIQLLGEKAAQRIADGASLEREVSCSRLPKKFKNAYSEIIHSVEKFSVRNFQSEILLMELRKY